MTCQEMVDFLMAYLDGELADEVHADFDRHLQVCPPCIDYIETYKEAVALGKSVCNADGSLPPDVPESLIEAILAARELA